MFGIKSARIMQLEHRVKVLESNLSATEKQRDDARLDRDIAKRMVEVRDRSLRDMERELANPFRTAPHQHNFAELEARVLADLLRSGDSGFYRGMSFGHWRARSPSLQNLPRRQPPKLIGLTVDYMGKHYSWNVGENYVVGLQVRPVYKDDSKLKVIVHHKDGSFSTRTYDKNLFTQPPTYLWKEQA